jgi:hypothetical protein
LARKETRNEKEEKSDVPEGQFIRHLLQMRWLVQSPNQRFLRHLPAVHGRWDGSSRRNGAAVTEEQTWELNRRMFRGLERHLPTQQQINVAEQKRASILESMIADAEYRVKDILDGGDEEKLQRATGELVLLLSAYVKEKFK